MSAGRYDVLVHNLDQASGEVAAAVTRGDLAEAMNLCGTTARLNVLLSRAHAASAIRRKEYDVTFRRRSVVEQRRGAAQAEADLAPLTAAAARALAAFVSVGASVSAAVSQQEAAAQTS